MTQRVWQSSVPKDALEAIQSGSLAYYWRGVSCLKAPFDIALYARLIWQCKPRTIIEIGNKAGGGAMFFADMQRCMGLAPNVLGIDGAPPQLEEAGLRFLSGKAEALKDTLTDEALADLPRPWLVSEDSAHDTDTTLAVMRFFDQRLRPGEYMVIEDGIMNDLGHIGDDTGPNEAIRRFLAECQGRYEIDTTYCDLYGHNATWATNGYLRRTTTG